MDKNILNTFISSNSETNYWNNCKQGGEKKIVNFFWISFIVGNFPRLQENYGNYLASCQEWC